jgi:branched-chain amino acid aminotransferase
MSFKFATTKTSHSRLSETDFSHLPFGQFFSDHMFIADYINGEWQDFRILPYGEIGISPANMALHYGQTIFEGMKAQRDVNGNVLLFRGTDHVKRINRSAERLGMPTIPEGLFLESIEALIKLDWKWVPEDLDSSLYIRPLLFATDGILGVRSSESFKLVIMTGPTEPYYPHPPKLWVEEHYVRSAVTGGTGFAKTAGNYASSIMPASIIRKKGYDQILWLDANEYKYIQECGTMNIFVVIGDKVLTPPLSDGILAGITRDTIITLIKEQGISFEERPIGIDEITQAHDNGTLSEIFGSGTAAVISHIDLFQYKLQTPTN